MVKFAFRAARDFVLCCGLVLIGLFVVGFVSGFRAEVARQQVAARTATAETVEEEVDKLVDEFMAIKVRATWPAVMDEMTNGSLVDSFVIGARSGGLELTESQQAVVRLVIVPRLKERMAESLEGYDENSPAKALFIALEELTSDSEQFIARYTPAIVRLLIEADSNNSELL